MSLRACRAAGYLIHRVELGRAYVKLGRQQDAARELEAAVDMDVPDINAVLQVRAACLAARAQERNRANKCMTPESRACARASVVVQQGRIAGLLLRACPPALWRAACGRARDACQAGQAAEQLRRASRWAGGHGAADSLRKTGVFWRAASCCRHSAARLRGSTGKRE